MFSTRRFLRGLFPDVEVACRLVAAYGFRRPTSAQFYKWLERDSMPASWLAVLLSVQELEHGKPVSVLAYIDR